MHDEQTSLERAAMELAAVGAFVGTAKAPNLDKSLTAITGFLTALLGSFGPLGEPEETLEANRAGRALKHLGALLTDLPPVAHIGNRAVDFGMIAAGHLVTVLAADPAAQFDMWADPRDDRLDVKVEIRERLAQVRHLRDLLAAWIALREAERFRR